MKKSHNFNLIKDENVSKLCC